MTLAFGRNYSTAVFVGIGTTMLFRKEIADSSFSSRVGVVSPSRGSLANFGYDVAISGGSALVGSPFDTVAGVAESGVADVFIRNGPQFDHQQKPIVIDDPAGDSFGASFAISDEPIAGEFQRA